jgi:hypothetical protein
MGLYAPMNQELQRTPSGLAKVRVLEVMDGLHEGRSMMNKLLALCSYLSSAFLHCCRPLALTACQVNLIYRTELVPF